MGARAWYTRLGWRGWGRQLLLLLPAAALATPALAQRARLARLAGLPIRADSQRVLLRRAGLPDTTRVKLLVLGAVRCADNSPDSARQLSGQALGLARRAAYPWGQAYALLNLAAANYYLSDYPAAQQAFARALTQARAVGQGEFVGHAYLGLGNVATELHDVAAAQRYFTQAQQAYARCRPRFVQGEQLVLYNQANGYLDAHQPDSARRLVGQGLALLRRYPQAGRQAKMLGLLGTVQQVQHHLDSAASSWQQATRLAHADHDAQAEGEAWKSLAEQARAQRQFAGALAYARRADGLLRAIGDPSQTAELLDVQAAALAALGRPGAYDTLRRYVSLRDTVLSQQRLEATATAQARFDQTEQQARIRGLEQEQRIATLEAQQQRLLLGGGVAGLLLLGGLGLAGYRRRQQRREAALRHQLAADLHDDVGTLLSQIALQTDLLQEGLGTPGEQQAHWAEVAGNSRLAVRQLNDVVWNLDAQNDTVPDLLHRLRDYAHEVLVPTGRQVRFVADEASGTDPALSAAVRRQLYFVFKEALHNILKYAPATATVTVTLRRQGATLLLDIANNGPAPAAGPGGRTSGHGLRNIQERARALGGQARSGPRAEGGFGVRVEVPGVGLLSHQHATTPPNHGRYFCLMQVPTPLAIIEDQPTIRQTYQTYLCAQPEFECVLVAGSVEEFLERLPEARRPPRLVLSDIGLPGLTGIEGVGRIRRVLPQAEVVLITVYSDAERLFQALCAGAVGYLLKTALLRDVKAGLLEVLAGGSPMSPAIARHLVRHFQPRPAPAEVLTPRELQLVQAIEEGLSYGLVAERLGISLNTVRTFIRRIYEKLEVNSRAELLARHRAGRP